jgi:CRP-like cAMP-binding protein
MVSGAAGHDHGCSNHSLDGDMHEPMLSGAEPERHQLLAALQADDRQRWHPHLEPVQLRSGQVLCEAGDTPAHVHFPISAVISLVSMTHDGGSAELAVVGHDGVVGIAVFMGGNAMPGQAVVQAGGLAMLLRYTQALMTHVAQTALCNRFHAIDQQLCRRLLLGLDRGGSDELVMTHEDTARLLGVRREGVTAAALGLQRAGVIRYHRGHIHVLDRGALERRACECYAAARSGYARLLPRPAALDGSIAMSCA